MADDVTGLDKATMERLVPVPAAGAPLLDRLLDVFYGAKPHPKTVRLTEAQAQRINYEMHPNEMRIAIKRDMTLQVFGCPVEWVDDEADSILGELEYGPGYRPEWAPKET